MQDQDSLSGWRGVRAGDDPHQPRPCTRRPRGLISQVGLLGVRGNQATNGPSRLLGGLRRPVADNAGIVVDNRM